MGEHGSELWDAVRGALASPQRGLPIERSASSKDPPLSYTQEGVWLHEQLYPRAGAYNTTVAVELLGPLDLSGLEAALNHVVRRHAILRTCFRTKRGVPFQQVSVQIPVDVDLVDLSHEADDARGLEIRRRALEQNGEPFDLREPPLWRFVLLRFTETTHVLLMTVHHIIWDQASFGVFLDDLAASYETYGAQEPSAQGDLEIQFNDFARWEREQADGLIRTSVDKWTSRLRDCSWHIELPLDKPRQPIPSFTGRSRWLHLGSELTTELESLSEDSDTTLFMTMMAAFAGLLMRYGNHSNLIIATPFSIRQRSELRPLIGPLVNLLTIPVDVHGNPTTLQLLQRVRDIVLAAYSVHDAPYARVLAATEQLQGRGDRRLPQAMFTLYRMPGEVTATNTLRFRPLEVEDGKARMEVELFAWKAEDGLHGRFILDTSVFDEDTMDRIADHYQNLLVGMVRDSSCRLSRLPLMNPSERCRLLEDWSHEPTKVPPEKQIQDLFDLQVANAREATAVVYNGLSLTYGDLGSRADRLVDRLHHRGVEIGSLVAIYLDRSPEFIVAMLAIVKAGGAYVPLDPGDPPERTLAMLMDCGARFLLTTSALQKRIQHGEVEILLLGDQSSGTSDTKPRGHSSVSRNTDRLAYVMYTSGSTGEPKGIGIPHSAVVDLVCETDYVTLNPGDRIAQIANPSFDAATFEIWGTLLNGGVLVILPRETILSPVALAAAVADNRVDTLFVTTALFNRIASEAPYAFDGVRNVLFGGEAGDPFWIRRILSHGAPARLVHCYGPTETTTFSTWHEIEGVPEGAFRVPIGRPTARTSVYVLDGHMQPVPAGVPGELYIGGKGLAWGYLMKPALTAKCFVPDPFSAAPGARLFRTRDLVRFLADGKLEFLDRIDTQVKIRGHRIELGEIEATLALHPNVEEATVTVETGETRQDSTSGKRLIAYIVPTQEQLPGLSEIRTFLKGKLPPYMIPSAFVPIEVTPQTPGGKVDRRALARVGQRQQMTEESFVAPHTELERKLAEIWKRVLWLDRDVGIHDDYFDLGGDSLHAVVLLSEIERTLETTIPLAALLRLTTIAELSAHIEPTLRDFEDSLAEALTSSDPQAVLAGANELPDSIYHRLLAFTAGWGGERLTPDGGLLVGLNLGGHKKPLFWCLQGFRELQQLATYLGKSQPVIGLRSGHLAMQYTAENTRALATHYAGEILRVDPEGPYYLGGNCQGAYIAWAAAEELRHRGYRVDLLCLQLQSFRQALPYPGRIALFLGSDISGPYATTDTPEPAWTELYPGGFSVDPISGTHKWHFTEPHIQDFSRKLLQRIEDAQTDTTRRSATRDERMANHPSRGVVVLGVHGDEDSVVTDLLHRLWTQSSDSGAGGASKEIVEVHDDFLESTGRTWDNVNPSDRALFRSGAAVESRRRLREIVAELQSHTRWMLEDPQMGRLLPLWDELFPDQAQVHFLHLFRSPVATAANLERSIGFTPEKGLFLWLTHHFDTEVATRDRPRSWLHLETFGAPLTQSTVDTSCTTSDPFANCGQSLGRAIEAELRNRATRARVDLDGDFEALRFQPWVAAAYRALIGLTQGREIGSRATLDALRFGIDREKRVSELDRLQEEDDRLREKNHQVWQESVRMRRENERLIRELDAALQRSPPDFTRLEQSVQNLLQVFRSERLRMFRAPLRWVYHQIRGTGRSD